MTGQPSTPTTKVMTVLRSTRTRSLALGVLAMLVLSACSGGGNQTTLEPAGPIADNIHSLWKGTLGIATVVFVLVEFGALFIIWKFRKRKTDSDDPSEFPEQLHGNTPLEIGWTILPALVLAVLGVFTVSTILSIAEEPDEKLVIDGNEVTIRVAGQQWWWSYDYDIDGDGVFADSDLVTPGAENPEEYASDIETAGELVIPVGVPIYLELNSRDVIHSFWIPALNGKKDTVPGRTHYLTIEADEPGTYLGQCTEFCGLSHAYMRMSVRALPMDEFLVWVDEQSQDAETPTEGLAALGATEFANNCASCHVVEGSGFGRANGEGEGFQALVAGAAPNLTHFASRPSYAGAIFDLWEDLDGDGLVEESEIGCEECRVDTNTLEEWLRNPAEAKPAAAGERRGMPDLNLSEAQIDQIVAYLLTLE